MALYIPHSIFHLARLLYVRPETFGPYYIQRNPYSEYIRVGRSADRIPVEAWFSAPLQTVPGAQPASCSKGAECLSRGQNVRGMELTTHPTSTEVKEKVELYFCSTFRASSNVLEWTLIETYSLHWAFRIWFFLYLVENGLIKMASDFLVLLRQ